MAASQCIRKLEQLQLNLLHHHQVFVIYNAAGSNKIISIFQLRRYNSTVLQSSPVSRFYIICNSVSKRKLPSDYKFVVHQDTRKSLNFSKQRDLKRLQYDAIVLHEVNLGTRLLLHILLFPLVPIRQHLNRHLYELKK